jgi:hypothetical protein
MSHGGRSSDTVIHPNEKPVYSAVFRYRGKNRPVEIALRKLLKCLLRAFDFECLDIVDYDWKTHSTNPAHAHHSHSGERSDLQTSSTAFGAETGKRRDGREK